MIRVKEGVKVEYLTQPILQAFFVIEMVYRINGHDEVWITSWMEEVRCRPKTSLHYKGLAIDIRNRDLSDIEKKSIYGDLRRALGKDYDVIWESDHFHIEYDPKEGKNV